MLGVVAIRVATALVAFLINVTFPLDQREQFTVFERTHYFWDTFARYDSGWYQMIASHGYAWAPGGRSNIAFFPAYPLIMGALGRLLGGTQSDVYFAGIVVSWVCSIGAAGFVYAVARLDLTADRAWHAVLLTFVFPFAFFFGVVYSEGLFLLGLSAAIYGLRTRRWLLGAVAGAVMTATRVNGIMALPALVWIAWRAAGDDRSTRVTALAAAGATSLGFLAFCLYNWQV
jgi:Gpi18-like mannosyltransferase